MSRRGVAALAAVVVALGAALVVGLRPDPPPAPPGPDLVALRAAAALAPCPRGLGPELPDLVLPCLGGGPDVALRSAPPGLPTLVNVWGSWCPPCTDEVPDLAAFATAYAGRVGVVGVDSQDTPEGALRFADFAGMRYPSVMDDDGVLLRATRPGPPATLFLDAGGRVVFTKHGRFRDRAEIERLVAEHLGVRR